MGVPYLDFNRREWAALRAATPLTLAEADLAELQGLNERVSLAEVETIYLPVSRLLNLHVAATQGLHKANDTFLGSTPARTPYVIGVAGSVAVGKSTFARILRALLARKGFPESYDARGLTQFLTDVKAATGAVHAPVYSHQSYDIVPGEFQVVDRPDIVIVEGLNVLQRGDGRPNRVFVSDFFDFSIYIDADEDDIEQWYVSRFQALRETVFRDPRSFFHRYASLSDQEALETALEIWRTINGVNLRENIQPTRERARLVLEKGGDHAVRRVRLRRP